MAITMQELARMAGVSRSTVDRALNGRGRVNPQTRDRICQLAESMGYEPDLAAKTLATKSKIFKIGCVLNSNGNLFFKDVEKGILAAESELNGFNLQIIIKEVEQLSVSCQLQMIEALVEEDVQAIAITPLNDPAIARRLNALIADGIPVIALTADITDVNYLSYVGCNHMKSGKITANIAGLIAKPDANILFVLGSTTLLGHNQRLLGFQTVLEKDYGSMKIAKVIENQDDDFVSYNKVHHYLSQNPEIDLVVFAAGGSNGGIRAILDLHYSCKIIAFDLMEHNKKYLEQGTVSCVLCQDPYAQGYQAVKILSNYLMLGKYPDSNRYYTKTEILVQNSL